MKEKMSSMSEIIIALIVCIAVGASVYFIKNKTDGDLIRETQETKITVTEKATENVTENAKKPIAKKITEKADSHEETTEEKTQSAEENLFLEIAGEYGHSSGAGAWYEDMKLQKDGTFSGKYHDWDASYEGQDGHGEGTVTYVREYTGKLTEVKRINQYSYTAKVADFKGKGELDSYTLGKDKTGRAAYTVVSKAPFEGSASVKIYLKGMPRKYADESVVSLVNSKIYDENKEWTELPYNVIISQGGYSRFTGYKSN